MKIKADSTVTIQVRSYRYRSFNSCTNLAVQCTGVYKSVLGVLWCISDFARVYVMYFSAYVRVRKPALHASSGIMVAA